MNISKEDRLQPKVETSENLIILTLTDGKTRVEENMIALELSVLGEDFYGHHLFLDFNKRGYVNSVELGTLVSLHKKMKAAGGCLTLFDLDPRINEVFEVTRLHTLLDIRGKETLTRENDGKN